MTLFIILFIYFLWNNFVNSFIVFWTSKLSYPSIEPRHKNQCIAEAFWVDDWYCDFSEPCSKPWELDCTCPALFNPAPMAGIKPETVSLHHTSCHPPVPLSHTLMDNVHLKLKFRLLAWLIAHKYKNVNFMWYSKLKDWKMFSSWYLCASITVKNCAFLGSLLKSQVWTLILGVIVEGGKGCNMLQPFTLKLWYVAFEFTELAEFCYSF